MPSQHSKFVHWFRQASPYIHAHRGKTCVISVPGEAAEEPNFAELIHDVALLQSLGLKIVIVHGARSQIDKRLALRNIKSQFINGCRITDQETLSSVQEAVGSVRIEIEALLSMGLINSPMHGARIKVGSGNFIAAKPIGILDGVDFQLSGNVRSIDTQAINRLLNDGSIVLISPLGYSATGEVFNLISENLANAVAQALSADKFICLTEHAEIKNLQGEPLRELTPDAKLIDMNSLSAITQRHVSAVFVAATSNVDRCHLISYKINGALLEELFTRDGGGTLISMSSYEQLQQANISHVGGILELLQPLEEQGVLIKRSRELLETEINQFIVLERDGMIIGCAALYPFAREQTAELACIVVHPDYRSHDRGTRLLEHVEKTAKAAKLNSLFVLTTQTTHWFKERAYVEKPISQLPENKAALYNFQRNSKVLYKAV